MKEVDLVVIMGTTLKVKPFGNIPLLVQDDVPQVLINRSSDDVKSGSQYTKEGWNNKLLIEGELDDSVVQIVKDCGWKTDFEEILPQKHRIKFFNS